MAKITNNKVDISQKGVQKRSTSKVVYNPADEPTLVDVSPALKQEIESQGLAYKFINATKLQRNFGHDHRGWVPYRVKDKSLLPEVTLFGSEDGFIRRGDMILAVIKADRAEMMKAKVEYRTQLQSGQSQRAKIREDLRNTASEIGARISDDYDADGE